MSTEAAKTDATATSTAATTTTATTTATTEATAASTAAAATTSTTTTATADAAVVPETYDLKLPDGSRLDPSRVEKIASLAKERKLSNEAAQEILTREHEVVEGYATAQQAAYQQQQEAWSTALKADKELGGDNLNKKVELASRVVNRFGTEEFKKALNETGLGNHPELVRVFARVAEKLGEDNLVLPGAAPAAGPKDLRDVFYPKQPK